MYIVLVVLMLAAMLFFILLIDLSYSIHHRRFSTNRFINIYPHIYGASVVYRLERAPCMGHKCSVGFLGLGGFRALGCSAF